MNTVLKILLVLFVGLFIIHQSHLIEKIETTDRVLGVKKEIYKMNWANLQNYINEIKKDFHEVPEKAEKFFGNLSEFQLFN